MRITINEEIERLWQLSADRKLEYDDLVKNLDSFKKNSKLTFEDKHWINMVKGAALYNIGRFQESIQIAEKDYQINKLENNILFTIDSLFLKWCNYYNLGRSPEIREEIMQCDTIINSGLQDSLSDIQARQSFVDLIIGSYHITEGNYDEAVNRNKKGLELIEQYEYTFGMQPIFLNALGISYSIKGELDLALEALNRALNLLKDGILVYDLNRALAYNNIGFINFQKNDIKTAFENYGKSLEILNLYPPNLILFWVGQIYNKMIKAAIYGKSLEKAKEVLDDFLHYIEKNNISKNIHFYKLGQAMILSRSSRTRNRAEAENILKSIIEKLDIRKSQRRIQLTQDLSDTLILICDLYLRELRLTNDLEILDDIQPYISQLLEESERSKSYPLQAETYLLQGKISLLQMNMGDARRYLTQAQRIAQEHGLHLLAREISTEHDKFLEQLDEWENLKSKKASFSERMDLASLDFTMDNLQKTRALNPPELVDEEPVLLLVMSRDGVSYFNYSFREDWDAEWLFSSFMSAFETFSSELFSESIDRIKIGEHLILINPVESFLVCYVIKGQSYIGLQKLNRFSDAIKWNTEIWETLNRAVQTGEELELDKIPSLGIILNDIFNLKIQETAVKNI
ncbi:MAG: tetratricopeptide repeat protein [Candidatus Thorarchaeota archaeon]